MLSEVDKRIIGGFVTAFLLLVVTMFFSYRNMSQFRSITFEVSHTHEVLFQIEEIYSNLLEIESSRRGFIIYGDKSFEDTYKQRSRDIAVHLDSLKKLVADNAGQLGSLDTLGQLIAQKIALGTMESAGIDQLPTPQNRNSLTGKRLTDAIRRVSEAMKSRERDLLGRRVGLANAANRQFYQLYVAFGLIILVIIVITLYIFRGRMKERQVAENALRQRSEEIRDLYDNAPCGYHSLDARGNFIEINNTLVRWLGYSKEEVLHKKNFSDFLKEEEREVFKSNFQLFKEGGRADAVEFELVRSDGTSFPAILNATAVVDENKKFVKDRASIFDITARKQAEDKAHFLNEELEAFSYSVSHDLRAPLRSIDSYTKIIAEEYNDKLDDEGKRLINIVLRNAARMSRLIDDLLDFSRLGRKELIKSTFNMKLLVQSVLEEMEVRNDDPKIFLKNEIALDAWGDKKTIRQVWNNLISNAIKYSSKLYRAELTFGCYSESHRQVYFIKDNGVGFDMAYYDKLFAVFQRLHSPKEYEGTGVGLALSHRIVTRHGGEMWAESMPDKGSTFYFSLPTKNMKDDI
ncbi:CHASE3 domain-containing protein [uncultured Imperialibacter sp.]|uniref:CHASE3 domain-containing protein n=1 Tax=uncultured Imperialibacter sp. TaxID=1672639 RepID=UPI0030DC0E72|tara:strand:- start:255624 stop:257348 length:1725 start_codon:yes stop_codon:yes gene_type:complete